MKFLSTLVSAEDGWICIHLKDGIAKHWAHFEGEVIVKLDRLYRPLSIEIEIKDTMDHEKEMEKNINKINDNTIEVTLAEGISEYWARFEGEIIMRLDSSYNPLDVEIEIKDIMDNENVLKLANFL